MYRNNTSASITDDSSSDVVSISNEFDKVFLVVDHNNVCKLIMNEPLSNAYVQYHSNQHYRNIQREFALFIVSQIYNINSEHDTPLNNIHVQIVGKATSIKGITEDSVHDILKDELQNEMIVNVEYSIIWKDTVVNAIERLRVLATKPRLSGYEKYELCNLRTCDSETFKPLVSEWNNFDGNKRAVIVSYKSVQRFRHIMSHIDNDDTDNTNDTDIIESTLRRDITCELSEMINDIQEMYSDCEVRCTKYASLKSSGSASRLDICV